MLSVGEAACLFELAAPQNSFGRQGLDEELTQRSPIDLRLNQAARAGLIEENIAMPVDYALGIFSR